MRGEKDHVRRLSSGAQGYRTIWEHRGALFTEYTGYTGCFRVLQIHVPSKGRDTFYFLENKPDWFWPMTSLRRQDNKTCSSLCTIALVRACPCVCSQGPAESRSECWCNALAGLLWNLASSPHRFLYAVRVNYPTSSGAQHIPFYFPQTTTELSTTTPGTASAQCFATRKTLIKKKIQK